MSTLIPTLTPRPARLALTSAIVALTLISCSRDTEPTTPPVAGAPTRLALSPAVLNLAVGRSGNLVARAVDAAGRPVSVSVSWSAADPTIATVAQNDGKVVALSPGVTTVTAAAGTLTATASISVRPPDPPVALQLSPSALSLIPGGIQRIVAYATDSTGSAANVPFEWVSADPAVATIGSTDGVVTAVARGVTTVTVTAGPVSATARVSVVEFAGSFAFTRTSSSTTGFASDVLLSSRSDPTPRSLGRPREIKSIAGAAWSPDQSLLVVEVVREFSGPPQFEWLEYTSDLYVADATAPGESQWRSLTTNGLSTAASWSPDGKRIAYLEQDSLFSTNHVAFIDPGGGPSSRLTLSRGYYGRPRWSPDGTRLAFSGSVFGGSKSSIFLVNADGSGLTPIAVTSTSDADPSWSPDGTQLAFVRFRNESPGIYSYEVAITDVTGRNVRSITSFTEYAATPTWSPDGRQIMVALSGAIHIMNADGSGLTRLSTPPNNSWDGAPTWRR